MSLKKLGRYDLIRVLGKGAMGLVYEGRDPNLDRRVAIKTIKVENLSDEAAADYEQRFRTEARSAARLQHPNIVSVYDSDRDRDIAYLVMEFIQGDDLKHHLDQGKRHTLDETLAIMADLLSALEYAHRQSIVHRDIKPANLLIEPGGRIKLTDFGVARIQDSGEATRTQGSIVGTLKYMAPEQVQGLPVDPRADLFAAGIVLYQLLTGRRPFDGDSDFAIIQQIVHHTPVAVTIYNPGLPPALDRVIARVLAKQRDLRYASATEFSAALQAAAREATDRTVVPPPGMPRPGASATWSATVKAGEALVGLNSAPGNFNGTNSGSATSTSTSVVTQELELVYWKEIQDSGDAEDFDGFLTRFPTGIYADLARRRLRKLGHGAGAGEETDRGSRAGTLSQTHDAATLVLPRSSTSHEATLVLPADSRSEPTATGVGEAAWAAGLAGARSGGSASRSGAASDGVLDLGEIEQAAAASPPQAARSAESAVSAAVLSGAAGATFRPMPVVSSAQAPAAFDAATPVQAASGAGAMVPFQPDASPQTPAGDAAHAARERGASGSGSASTSALAAEPAAFRGVQPVAPRTSSPNGATAASPPNGATAPSPPEGATASPPASQAAARTGFSKPAPDTASAPPASRTGRFAALAAAVVVVGGAVLWMMGSAGSGNGVGVSGMAEAPLAASSATSAASASSAPASAALVATPSLAPSTTMATPPPAADAAVATASAPATAASAAAAKAAARKLAQEARAAARQAQSQAKSAPGATEAAATAATSAAAPDAAARRAEAAAPSGSGPRAACENRVLLGFQMCMSEQCAKPAFAQHPVCVERRAMEQRRNEAQSIR